MRVLCHTDETGSEMTCFILGGGGRVFSATSVKRLYLKKNSGYVRDTVSTKTTNCFMSEDEL